MCVAFRFPDFTSFFQCSRNNVHKAAPCQKKNSYQNSAGKGGVLGKVPSGTALVELLDKWLRLPYACDLKRRENLKDRKVVLEEIEVLGGSLFKACLTEIDDDNEDFSS